MTTSPEALREAVERLTNVVGAAPDSYVTCSARVADLKALLSALQEAREALGQRDGLLHSWVELKDRLGGDSFDGIEPTYVLQLDQLAATTRLAVGCDRD